MCMRMREAIVKTGPAKTRPAGPLATAMDMVYTRLVIVYHGHYQSFSSENYACRV